LKEIEGVIMAGISSDIQFRPPNPFVFVMASILYMKELLFICKKKIDSEGQKRSWRATAKGMTLIITEGKVCYFFCDGLSDVGKLLK